jgi:hypothetical protein
MTESRIKKLYNRYFQKSKTFLVPILGIKRDSKYPFLNSYVEWRGKYKIGDQKLILTFEKKYDDPQWDEYLLTKLMGSKMFNEYHELEDDLIAVSFDLHCIEHDYRCFINGTYSLMSRLMKQKIRDYYGVETPEWVYMETFLFPARFTKLYSTLLDVDEEHIKFTGELCDKPNLQLETLKLKENAKINDVHPLIVEQGKDL